MSANTQTQSQFQTLAERFGTVVDAVPADAWGRPSPCEGWTATDVVAHVVDTQRDFLERAGVDVPARPAVAAGPAAAWREHRAALDALLADPAVADRAYTSMFGDTTVGAMLSDFYGFDLVVHRSDLARAAGVADQWREEEMDAVEQGADGFGEHLYQDGVCAVAVDVPADASRADRLLGRLGRDPRWAGSR